MMSGYERYQYAIAGVLRSTEASERSWATGWKRKKLPGGVPFRFVHQSLRGPQCVTVSLQVREEDLKSVMSLAERFAYAAGSAYARVYRDLSVVRIEFTLPQEQWAEVRLGRLRDKKGMATVGQTALGPIARIGWGTPHKAVFGTTQSGKTTALIDFIISLARSNAPDELAMLLINPKNDEKLQPLHRLRHLAARAAVSADDSVALLRWAEAEMEKRMSDPERRKRRLVFFIDEVADLVEQRPDAGPIITRLSQKGGGLLINLIVASQAANPSVFGERGSLAVANFPSRLVFMLPRDQSYLATGQPLSVVDSSLLGGLGDGVAIFRGQRVTRFRSALPEERDYASLPLTGDEPEPPREEDLAGDREHQDDGNGDEQWPELGQVGRMLPPDMLHWALLHPGQASATQLQKRFGGAMGRARLVRDYLEAIKRQHAAYQQLKGEAS